MRLFCALVLPDDMKEMLADIAHSIRREVRGRYVRPSSYHLTLAFIGDVDAAEADHAAGALIRSCSGTGTISITPSFLGSFGPRSNATLWVGCNPADDIASLAQSLRSELKLADIPFDPKPFRAHVTIARHVDLNRSTIPGIPLRRSFTVPSAALFESKLDPNGAEYRIIERVLL